MKWIKYELHTNTRDAEALGEILTECGIPGYEITDHVPLSEKEERQMFTDISGDFGIDDGSSVLTFYTEAPDNTEKRDFSTGSSLRDKEAAAIPVLPPQKLIEKIQRMAEERQAFFPLDVPQIQFSEQDDSLWKDKWKENFQPFRLEEGILIKPTWCPMPEDVREGDIVVQIDPGSAFGTGTHETTKLCLQSMRKYITPETRILDAGCGSGILAIAALLCGARSAFCLDVDPAAVSGTLENARNNGLDQSRLTAVHANILEDSNEVYQASHPPYHIVAANILADVIIPLSRHIGRFMDQNGVFISSGILAEKAGEVEQALAQNHFQVIEKNTLGDWVAFVCRLT